MNAAQYAKGLKMRETCRRLAIRTGRCEHGRQGEERRLKNPKGRQKRKGADKEDLGTTSCARRGQGAHNNDRAAR